MSRPPTASVFLKEIQRFREALYDALMTSDAARLRGLLEDFLIGTDHLAHEASLRKLCTLPSRVHDELPPTIELTPLNSMKGKSKATGGKRYLKPITPRGMTSPLDKGGSRSEAE